MFKAGLFFLEEVNVDTKQSNWIASQSSEASVICYEDNKRCGDSGFIS